MSIFSLGFLRGLAATAGLLSVAQAGGIAPMTAAIERGDIDEASRLGVLAGPTVIEQGLASPVRATQLAAIAAAPAVEARAELLPALATLAGSPDRRTAIPATQAARSIARELARAAGGGEFPDDLDTDEVASWRAQFDQLAGHRSRFIEVRVLALDTAASLAQVIDPREVGFDLAAVLGDPDPAIRAVAIALVPRPTPAAARAPLANAVKNDADDKLALAAAQVLCGDDREPALALLGAQGLDRIKSLVVGKQPKATRDARQCLAR